MSCSAAEKMSSIAESEGWEYEVFLSFRGADTRTTFTDFLYEDLVHAGIRTFRDDDELRIGEEIGGKLFSGIDESKIFIPIFSKGYANSKWCLREVALMVEYSKTKGRKILPIFYDVEPTHVKNQKGTYEKAFEEHESNSNVKKEAVKEWREALAFVAELKGCEVMKAEDGHQGKFIKKFVSRVFTELNHASLDVTEHLVGIDDGVAKVKTMLDVTSRDDVRIIGIYGLGGIGKTTFAKFIYNQLSDVFHDCCCFLADIREKSEKNGILELQNQMISKILGMEVRDTNHAKRVISERFRSKRVLILLDDVDSSEELDSLIKSRDCFGPGSRFIVTTRNKFIFEQFEVFGTHEIGELNFNDSLQLFCKHAFKSNTPLENFAPLCKEIVSTTGGLPLSLRVVGSLLHNKKKETWERTLRRLREAPQKEVQEALKISYDGLDDRTKSIFLDIACLFTNEHAEDLDLVSYMWDSQGLLPEYGIAILVNMSLVKIDGNNKLQMNNHIRDVGREIVAQEKHQNKEMSSRLWNKKEAFKQLKGEKTGAEVVKAVRVDIPQSEYVSKEHWFSNKELKKFSGLAYFHAGCVDLWGNFDGLLPDLRWLRWSVQHSWMLNMFNFRPKNLVILDLSNSKVTKMWRGWRLIKEASSLKVLDLSNCEALTITPAFPHNSVLERLILKSCEELVEVHTSVGYLKHLISLNLSGCKKLKKLPQDSGFLSRLSILGAQTSQVAQLLSSIGSLTPALPSFEVNWSVVANIPQALGSLQNLQELSRDAYSVRMLPEPARSLNNLQNLCLDECKSLSQLPEFIGDFESLTELNLVGSKVEKLPPSTGKLRNLRVLNIRGSRISELPDFVCNLEKLEEINASECQNLEGDVPRDIGRLSRLGTLNLRGTKIRSLPESICRLSSLQVLDLHELKLEEVPELPSSLTSLSASALTMNRIFCLSKLVNLETLELDDLSAPKPVELSFDVSALTKLKRLSFRAYISKLPSGFGSLSQLVNMKIVHGLITSLPEEIESLYQLRELALVCCRKLQCLPTLPPSLSTLTVSGCSSMHNLGDLSNLKALLKLIIDDCPVKQIHGLHVLQSLGELSVALCRDLSTVDGLEHLTGLKKLRISYCKSLAKLPNLSALNCKPEISDYNK